MPALSSNVEYRPCPLCRSDSRTARSRAVIVREHKRYEIIECRGCGFVYVGNPDSSTVDDEGRAADEIRRHPIKRRQHHIQNLIRARVGSDASDPAFVVEIGAGTGGLGRLLQAEEYVQYQGFEPSAARAEWCRRDEVNVVQGYFSRDQLEREADVIVMDNVLEHVLDPRALVAESVGALSAGGMLVVIVPNLHDVRRFMPAWRRCNYWQPHCHLSYFTSSHLRHLFSSEGLSYHSFGFDVLDMPQDWDYLPKIALDGVGLPLLGLYCYGIKR